MEKRARKFGESFIQLIGNSDVIDVLRPINATRILKKVLEYNQKGEEPTYSIVARDLEISPSTVLRNIVRFNTNTVYLVETEEHGKEYTIRLTSEGKRIARLIENSESIEMMEEDRKNTESLIEANTKLSKKTKTFNRYKEIILGDLLERKKSLESEIKILSKEKGFDSKIRMRELQQRLLPIDNEISDLIRYINEKKSMLESLKGENYSLQQKLENFLLKNNW
jgi:predicted RNase H-like nuclease (RuvC/YqgF family)